VNAQLTALGHDVIYSFNHDVQRLPDGGTAVIGLTERTVNINGTPTNYVGMMVIVLNADFHVTWAWDAFEHLDVNRGPILGEVLHQGDPDQLTASTPTFPAVDWLHINAVSWSPADENLVLSVRHQDWVLKIDYRNGEGDGHIIWRLGQGGDFTVNSTAPNPWFSHQHNAHYVDDHTLILFDNGNTRRASDPNAHSRGQVWTLDEQTMTATLVVNADLGSYSGALGAAERLSNGDYSFTLGTNGPEPLRPPARTVEVNPDGTKVYELRASTPEYRIFRVRTLYGGISDSLADPPSVASANSHFERHADTALPVTSDLLAAGAGSSSLSPDAIAAPNPVFASLRAQGNASINGLWDAISQPSAADLENGFRQWLMSQQTLTPSRPVAGGPSFPISSASGAQSDGSLWNDPFAALVLDF